MVSTLWLEAEHGAKTECAIMQSVILCDRQLCVDCQWCFIAERTDCYCILYILTVTVYKNHRPYYKFIAREFSSSSFIIFHRAKISTWSITYLCWCNWRTFWRKTATVSSQRVFFYFMKTPLLTRQFQTKQTGLPRVQYIDPHPIFPNRPRRTAIWFEDWKFNWKIVIFLTTWRSFQQRKPGWTEKFWFFLSGLQKLEQLTKKYIELRGEYVE